MSLHFRVRTVLLSGNGTAVTLEPVDWGRWAYPDGTLVDPQDEPSPSDELENEWVRCAPHHKWAEPLVPGGKMTELRFDHEIDWRPGDYVSFGDPARFSWGGVNRGVQLHGVDAEHPVLHSQT